MWAIIVVGVVLRVVVFFQNRNMFIDEANIARNIYERTFMGLAMPLSYEQYAPPVFLWILKGFTSIGGYGEYAFRIYALLTGIGVLLLFVQVAKKMGINVGIIYPLALLAVGLIFVRYSTETKQYMPDAFICLLLVWLALTIDIFKGPMIRFVVIWTIAGSVSIWASMPSVFVLAGVGVYYGTLCVKKNTRQLMPVIIVSVLWLMQFLFYYVTILQPQANSDYLHNFHKDFFVFLLPHSFDQFHHNFKLMENLFSEAAGYTFFIAMLNGVLLLVGAYMLFRRQPERALLFVVPIVAMVFAAGLNQFSLVPRVCLFIMPVFLLLMAAGFEFLWKRQSKIVQVVLVVMAIIGVNNHNQLKLLVRPLTNEEITVGMKLLKDNGLTAKDVYVHTGAVPAYIYYTEIHPAMEQWKTLKFAHMLHYGENCEVVTQGATQAGFVFANGEDNEMRVCREGVLRNMAITASLTEKGCSAYIYKKK